MFTDYLSVSCGHALFQLSKPVYKIIYDIYDIAKKKKKEKEKKNDSTDKILVIKVMEELKFQKSSYVFKLTIPLENIACYILFSLQALIPIQVR